MAFGPWAPHKQTAARTQQCSSSSQACSQHRPCSSSSQQSSSRWRPCLVQCQGLALGPWVRQVWACGPQVPLAAPWALPVRPWGVLWVVHPQGQAVVWVGPCLEGRGQPCLGSCLRGPLVDPGLWDQEWEVQEVSEVDLLPCVVQGGGACWVWLQLHTGW